MDPIDTEGPQVQGGDETALADSEIEYLFASVAFGIVDAVVLSPMRSEMRNMMEEDQSSSTFF